MQMRLGLGTQLRQLLAELDGGVQAVYDAQGVAFRPRFYPVVLALLAQSPLSVGKLAAQTGVSQPATTQTLALMEKLGLVEMAPGKSDRRARSVRLSEHGRAQARALDAVWGATHAAAERLDTELSCDLADLIAEALDALERRSFDRRIADELERTN